MKTIVSNIQESRSLLNEYYDDLDSYETLFEEEIMEEELISENNQQEQILDELIDLKEKFEAYTSNSKNADFAEGEDSAYLKASEQLERLIKKFRKDYYG